MLYKTRKVTQSSNYHVPHTGRSLLETVAVQCLLLSSQKLEMIKLLKISVQQVILKHCECSPKHSCFYKEIVIETCFHMHTIPIPQLLSSIKLQPKNPDRTMLASHSYATVLEVEIRPLSFNLKYQYQRLRFLLDFYL